MCNVIDMNEFGGDLLIESRTCRFLWNRPSGLMCSISVAAFLIASVASLSGSFHRGAASPRRGSRAEDVQRDVSEIVRVNHLRSIGPGPTRTKAQRTSVNVHEMSVSKIPLRSERANR